MTFVQSMGLSTEYRGPTDHLGSRIIVRDLTSKRRLTVSWKYALGVLENHTHAAQKAATHFGWGDCSFIVCSVHGGGYIYVLTPEVL